MGTRTLSIALLVIALVMAMGVAAMAADEPAAAEEQQAAPAQEQAAPDKSCTTALEIDPTLELGVTENAKGTVYLYDERRPEVWATIGTRDGLRPTAVVAFVRRGEVVAQGCVTTVRNADCVIAPAPGTPAGQILLGDDVRVLVNGPREAMDAVIARENSDRALGAFAMFAILFGNIWAARY
ncbi:MAG: hypothetical protein ACE149_10345 [Armatimonadota bacterium]